MIERLIVQGELEEQLNLVKAAEDHAKKASSDASRLAEELRQEQDHSSQIEKARRTAETVAKDLQTRLDEAEAAAMQGGRKIVQKMEQVRSVMLLGVYKLLNSLTEIHLRAEKRHLPY